MNREQIFLAIVVPIYFVAMMVELYFQNKKERAVYQLPDTLMSFWFALMGTTFDLLMKGVCFLVLDWFNDHAVLSPNLLDIYPIMAWVLVFFAQDLAFYWLHRTEHTSRIFWAVHSNHHSSPNYNFAVALRSSVFQPLYRFIFYIPVAWLGFDGLTIMFMYSANQFYQFWLHTETIPKLPKWMEYIFVTPSHHRVHHANNVRYLDRNMGQVLIIWDRMFGTFQEELEEDKPEFGLTKQLETSHPIRAILHEFYLLRDDWKRADSYRTKLRYLFARPGWSHDGRSRTAEQLRQDLKQKGLFVLFVNGECVYFAAQTNRSPSMKNITVIGSGTMGNGIAHVFAQNGYQVSLVDINPQALEKALATITRNMDRQIQKGTLSEDQKASALANITTHTDMNAGASNADLVVEAASENFDIKTKIFKQLDEIVPSSCILATNTSSISITKLAAHTKRPDKVIGMHFMNPVPVMKLVEVIKGYHTSDEVNSTILKLSKDVGKTPTLVADYPGFVANRILLPMINEAIYTLYEGIAGVEEIDTVMKLGMAHPMGPLQLADFIGLDVCHSILNVLYDGFGNQKYAPCPLLEKMVLAGDLGVKSGRGFYDYSHGTKDLVVAKNFN